MHVDLYGKFDTQNNFYDETKQAIHSFEKHRTIATAILFTSKKKIADDWFKKQK